MWVKLSKTNFGTKEDNIITDVILISMGDAEGHFQNGKQMVADIETLTIAEKLINDSDEDIPVTVNHSNDVRDQLGLVVANSARVESGNLIADIRMLNVAFERSTGYIGEYIMSISSESNTILNISVEMDAEFEIIDDIALIRPTFFDAVSIVKDGALTAQLINYEKIKNNELNNTNFEQETDMSIEKQEVEAGKAEEVEKIEAASVESENKEKMEEIPEEEKKEEVEAESDEEKEEEVEAESDEEKEEEVEAESDEEKEEEVEAESDEEKEEMQEEGPTLQNVMEVMAGLAEAIARIEETLAPKEEATPEEAPEEMSSEEDSEKVEMSSKRKPVTIVEDIEHVEADADDDKLDFGRINDPVYFRNNKSRFFAAADALRKKN